tara:strand:- start:10171 stop:10992 length:822 start_codon:yes stop_codon:yes gene_type:complete
MKNKKKFTILLFAMFFMVFGAVGAVFHYETPGGGVVYAQGYFHGDFSASSMRALVSSIRNFKSNKSCNNFRKSLLRRYLASGGSIASLFPPPPPPPPPPSFGVSSGGTSGATGGASSGTGTGAASVTINEGGAVTMSFACVNSTSSSGVNFSTGGDAEGSVSINPLNTTTYTVVCSNGGRSSVDVTVLHPVLEITADPIQVRSGRESLITWSATVVDSCNVTGTNGFSATGLSGSQPSNPITLQSIFTLTCENVAGTLSKNVTVYLIPEFREF